MAESEREEWLQRSPRDPQILAIIPPSTRQRQAAARQHSEAVDAEGRPFIAQTVTCTVPGPASSSR